MAYRPNREQARNLIVNNCGYSFSMKPHPKDAGVYTFLCHIEDKELKRVFCCGEGDTEQAAMDDAIAKMPAATRPMSTVEMVKELERLRNLTAAKELAALDRPTVRHRNPSGPGALTDALKEVEAATGAATATVVAELEAQAKVPPPKK